MPDRDERFQNTGVATRSLSVHCL